MPRHVFRTAGAYGLVTCLAVGLGLVVCRLSAGEPEPAASSSTVTTSVSDTDATSRPATATTSEITADQGFESTVIAWIRDLGPLGGASGSDDGVFSAIATGDCDTALKVVDGIVDIGGPLGEPDRTLYGGAASACLAAVHNQTSAWPRAQTALAALRPVSRQLNCLDRIVYDLLDRLVELHQRAPNARVVMGSGGNVVSAVCPRILALIPDHGPVEGGYPIQVIGVDLPRTVVIHFGDHSLTVETNSRHYAEVIVPPGDPADREGLIVAVWPEGSPFGAIYNTGFAYDLPEPTPTDTPSVSPTTG